MSADAMLPAKHEMNFMKSYKDLHAMTDTFPDHLRHTPGSVSRGPAAVEPQRCGGGGRRERRRTDSMSRAFAELRACLPHLPADTKLSKLKTLHLAVRYISFLTDVLHGSETRR